jgi:hypothetical protein
MVGCKQILLNAEWPRLANITDIRLTKAIWDVTAF